MKRRKQLFIAAYILLCVIFLFQIVGQRKILSRMKTQYEKQEKLLKEKEKENNDLKDLLEKMDSDDFIEKEARERFNMIKEGEIPVKNKKNNDEKNKEP